MNYIIALLCFGIIFLRQKYTEFIFDDKTFYLILIAIFALYLPKPEKAIRDILGRIKKFKHKDTEIELDEIKNVENKLKTVFHNLSPKSENDQIDYIVEPFEISDPKIKLLTLFIEVEKLLREIAVKKEPTGVRKRASPVVLSRELGQKEIIPQEISSVISDLWPLRNKIVHAETEEIDLTFIDRYIQVMADIIRILQGIKESAG